MSLVLCEMLCVFLCLILAVQHGVAAAGDHSQKTNDGSPVDYQGTSASIMRSPNSKCLQDFVCAPIPETSIILGAPSITIALMGRCLEMYCNYQTEFQSSVADMGRRYVALRGYNLLQPIISKDVLVKSVVRCPGIITDCVQIEFGLLAHISSTMADGPNTGTVSKQHFTSLELQRMWEELASYHFSNVILESFEATDESAVDQNEDGPNGDDPEESDPKENGPEDPKENSPNENDPKEEDPKENDPKENGLEIPKENDPNENDPKEGDPNENDPYENTPSEGDPSTQTQTSTPDELSEWHIALIIMCVLLVCFSIVLYLLRKLSFKLKDFHDGKLKSRDSQMDDIVDQDDTQDENIRPHPLQSVPYLTEPEYPYYEPNINGANQRESGSEYTIDINRESLFSPTENNPSDSVPNRPHSYV